MAAIKGVGEGIVDSIVEDRDANGPFEGLMDFCARIPKANKKVIENVLLNLICLPRADVHQKAK